MRVAAFPLVASLFLLSVVPAYAAQGSEAPTLDQQAKSGANPKTEAETLPSQVESLSEALQQLRAEIKPLRADLAAAKGPQKDLLQSRLEEKEQAAQTKLDELAALVIEREKAGDEVAGQRATVESMTRQASRDIRKVIDGIRASLKETIARSTTDAAEKERLNKEGATLSERLEYYLRALLANASRATALGMDPAEDLAYLDDILQQWAETLAGSIALIGEQRDAANKKTTSSELPCGRSWLGSTPS